MDDKQPTDGGHAAPAHGHGLGYPLIGIFLVARLCGAWGLWAVFAPRPNDLGGQVRAQRERMEILEQQVATLKRSDQVSREANLDLQGTLAERDEEIAGLRADRAVYERFVGSTSQRHGLAVHALPFQAPHGTAWHFPPTPPHNPHPA